MACIEVTAKNTELQIQETATNTPNLPNTELPNAELPNTELPKFGVLLAELPNPG
jgi:hypothetical protein